ncbi:MAG: tRNA (N6-threonylcarbamoyladenosine(37)-N6)-methyltransferase TrmO [Bacteroidales bacterium]|jgi:tRNA-Thr(GGU) m(6)t(6)A37 methyltransferase TsaA|nr:tRNA (N6-threonylcarbamoyladenosine(37)-N6)-methyltransferase TrmO [Bacteroidales bacterium]
MDITFRSIGIIHTPFKVKEGMPIQPGGAQGIKGSIILKEKYTEGLADLPGFSHIYLIYYLHKSSGYNLQVIPFLDNTFHGVFATRAPRRPNAIGISVVRLISIRKNILKIENVDMLDGTPLLDIKPYIPEFDILEVENRGWARDISEKVKQYRTDARFK